MAMREEWRLSEERRSKVRNYKEKAREG